MRAQASYDALRRELDQANDMIRDLQRRIRSSENETKMALAAYEKAKKGVTPELEEALARAWVAEEELQLVRRTK